jgi:methionyl-tRNA formyltransferase
MTIGAALILKTVQAVAANNYPQVPQDLTIEQPAAPKIFKETCKINWQQPAKTIYNFIRGMSPYPAAWTMLDGKMLKIYFAEISAETATQKAGMIETDNKTFIKVCAADCCLTILEVQLEGKKKMKVDEFLRGYKIQELAFQS